MPTASAKPPSVMVLTVCPKAHMTATEVRIDSGIEIITIKVDLHDPRKIRIVSAVSPAAMAPSRKTLVMAVCTKTD